MKFLIFALCLGVAFAELPIEELPIEELPIEEVVIHEEQVHHEQEIVELCKEQGVFANPHDPEHRTFIRCELEPIEMQCDDGFIFSEESLMCVEKPQPPAPVDLNTVDWRAILTCPEVQDKFFRNPYDCSKFYRCYVQGEFKRMDPMTCVSTMIFDEVLETCLPAEQFKSIYGVECHNAPLPEILKPEEQQPEVPEVPEQTEEHPKVPEVPEQTEEHPEIPEVPEQTEEHPEIPEVPEVPEEQVHHEQEIFELCKEQGVFANPHDPEHRTFIRCQLEPIELHCDDGFLFNEESLMCVEKPQPPAPVDLNAVNWREVLTCPEVEDKYYRNPYDCSKFYRCYVQGEFKRMDPMTCISTMIFDEVLETCLPAEQFKSLYGVECHNAPLPEIRKPEEQQPEVPEIPEQTEEHPEIPEVPEQTEEHPEVPEVPEQTEEHPEIPEVPEVPEQTEEHPEIPEVPEQTEEHPEVPEVPEQTEEHPEVPEVPEQTEEHVPVQEAEKPNLNEILKQIKDLFSA